MVVEGISDVKFTAALPKHVAKCRCATAALPLSARGDAFWACIKKWRKSHTAISTASCRLWDDLLQDIMLDTNGANAVAVAGIDQHWARLVAKAIGDAILPCMDDLFKMDHFRITNLSANFMNLFASAASADATDDASSATYREVCTGNIAFAPLAKAWPTLSTLEGFQLMRGLYSLALFDDVLEWFADKSNDVPEFSVVHETLVKVR